MSSPRIAVVIPCFKVQKHILNVLALVGPEVEKIYVVDDCCPEQSGQWVKSHCKDPRVQVIFNARNLGVGGATITGYKAALEDHMDLVVKVDGDEQMDPRLIPKLIRPIIDGSADYTKGNRFYSYELVRDMPKMRVLGNGVLSFFIKISSGYWNILDPNNGYTAIHRAALQHIDLDKISQGYFFESDLLFRLNTVRAVVMDVPMQAVYGEEKSNLKILQVMPSFVAGHIKNFFKRIAYNYFLRDMNIASFELVLGVAFLVFGIVYGGIHWANSLAHATYAPGGVIMLAALSVMLGTQLLLSAINYDVQNVPSIPLQKFFSGF